MKILLLGATGRTGRLVLKYLINNGHKVHCLARKTYRIEQHNNVKLFEGDPTNKKDLKKAIYGTDYVISVLNISRKSDFPWAPLRTSKTFLSDVLKELTELAEEIQIKRLIVCSAWGVSESRKDIPIWFRWTIDNSNIGWAYKDHHRQEEIIIKSKINWTIVRPVGLTNSKKKEEIKMTFNNYPKPNILISRLSVAKFLVDTITKSDLVNKVVVISKK
ncbi:NAD(P)-dependent oxidoreductase [Croceivirga thetidis]|uniref:NAD(P)H-binding protein n=1 Tax=Croceivirga thetidis TaxID=2721623 RepID=A0ABX1GUE1_9FLAO|nr:NAD(P)-binding oxidoreductase [Croceivirga thetidis]NKI33538.1 NAD(P)H-binding protein [Croceivirga thetidis]